MGKYDLLDIRRELQDMMSAKIALVTDKVIAEAVSAKLGSEWSLPELNGRLHSTRIMGDTFETISLDGVPILELYDPVFEPHQPDAHTHRIKVTQNYRRL